METFQITTETCTKCGSCVEVCPAGVLYHNEHKYPAFSEPHKSVCLVCGQCMAVCTSKSIIANGLHYESDFFEFQEKSDFFSVLEHRRSVRRFKAQPVSKAEIEKIIEAVALAPHGDSKHHVEITIVHGREKIMQAIPTISAFYDKLGKWLHNPFMRFMIGRKVGISGINTLMYHLLPRIELGVYRNYTEEYDGITRGASTLMLFHAPKDAPEHTEDAYIMVIYAALAAQALGLGATIVGLVPPAVNKLPELRKMWNIPETHTSIVSLILGNPKYKYRRGIKRQIKQVRWIE